MPKIYLILFLSLCFAQNSFAQLQTITSLSALEGEAFGNNTHKEALISFAEYPLSKKTAIGGSAQLSHVSSNHNSSSEAYAFNSVELFHRYKFFSSKHLGITVHNSYKFGGSYNENNNLALMPKQDDYELRFLFAHNMPDRLVNTVVQNETPYFVRAEVAYRRRFSNPFDEYRFTFWSGVKINEKFSFLLQDNITWNVNAKETALHNSRQNFANFNISKTTNNLATFSLLYHCDKETTIQFGYARRLAGNNPFYDYDGPTVALWKSF